MELHSPQSLLYPDGVCFSIQSSKHCDLVFINIWSPGDKENGGQFWYTIEDVVSSNGKFYYVSTGGALYRSFLSQVSKLDFLLTGLGPIELILYNQNSQTNSHSLMTGKEIE